MAVEIVVPDDIVEQILIRSDVKVLVRFKNVCKSWQSLISGDRFIKAHLNHSYNNDHNNNKIGHRRICFTRDNLGCSYVKCYFETDECNLLGSSNGLVCISSSHDQVMVANPLTRDVKKLPNPNNFDRHKLSACWGFGYDSSTDDYKVIAGFSSGSCSTSFQVLTLKTNVWKDVGTLKYMRYKLNNAVGILCNGKLHWLMEGKNVKVVIISFDLFEEKFEEISQPDEFKYDRFSNLGVIEECLCICDYRRPKWVMKNYNVRESWVPLQYALENDNDVVHLIPIKDSLSNTSFFTNDDLIMSKTRYFNCVPMFVRSLVSPNVTGELKRKSEA